MQESHTPATTSPAAVKGTPLHDDIAQCARDLWVKYGRPTGRDLEIWLEAEKRLLSATQTQREKNSAPASTPALPSAKPARAYDRSAGKVGAPGFRAAPLADRPRTNPKP
jgi:hypothetical protein